MTDIKPIAGAMEGSVIYYNGKPYYSIEDIREFYNTGKPNIENAPFRGGSWHWITVSNMLYEEMKDTWSKPIQARVAGEVDQILVLEFRDVEDS